MNKYIFLILLCFIGLNCGRTPTEPEIIIINATYRIISYNEKPAELIKDGLIIPQEIRLIDYIEGEIIQADVKFWGLGWFSSSDKYNDVNEIYVLLPPMGDYGNISFIELVINETNIEGIYYWGFTEFAKIRFVAVKKG